MRSDSEIKNDEKLARIIDEIGLKIEPETMRIASAAYNLAISDAAKAAKTAPGDGSKIPMSDMHLIQEAIILLKIV